MLDHNDVPLDTLVLDPEAGTIPAGVVPRTGYTPLHPSIYGYTADIIDPRLRAGDPMDAVVEDAEQIYRFPLFAPDFCRLLVEEAEHSGEWETRRDIEDHPMAGDSAIKNYSPWDTTQWLDRMPGLERLYFEVVRRHVEPLMKRLWPVFRIQRMKRPYILKYEPSVVAEMGLHFDVETVTLIAYLNDDFDGGGTWFPRWSYSTGKPPIGTGILYPGGLSHVHAGLRITRGKRFLFCGAYF